MLTIDEAMRANVGGKDVLIIGPPSSGKTYLSGKLNGDHTIIHTDDYARYGYKESLYKLLEDIKKVTGNTIVEGVQGYRLLRKGAQLRCYYPDLVIELSASKGDIRKVYLKERDAKKLKYLASFNRMHDQILKDYLAIRNNKKPEWLKVFNDMRGRQSPT